LLEGWDATRVNDFTAETEAFLLALPAASKETVLTQKYLAFFNQAYQAWFEYNRTGEPEFMLKPGEIASVDGDGNPIYFTPLVIINTLPKRMTYPQQEFTVNGANVTAAAIAVGGDQMSTKLWWQP